MTDSHLNTYTNGKPRHRIVFSNRTDTQYEKTLHKIRFLEREDWLRPQERWDKLKNWLEAQSVRK